MSNTKILLISIFSCLVLVLSGCGAAAKSADNSSTPSSAPSATQTPDSTPTVEPSSTPAPSPTSQTPDPQVLTDKLLAQEDTQIKELPQYEPDIFTEDVQKALTAVYKEGDDLQALIDKVKDQTVKDKLIKLQKAGYMIETGEGMFYPVIDYEQYLQYRDDVIPAAAAYFDIMAAESMQRTANDAALAITWDELVQRALNLESFIANYPDFVRTPAMQDRFKNFQAFILYGLNNTPLFDYDTKTINAEAYAACQKAVQEGNPAASKLLSVIKDYLPVIDKNGGKLTKEVEAFQKAHDPYAAETTE